VSSNRGETKETKESNSPESNYERRTIKLTEKLLFHGEHVGDVPILFKKETNPLIVDW